MKRSIRSAVFLLASSLVLAHMPIPAGEDALILDESDYCRAYLQFGCDRISPATLQADGAKVLEERGLQSLGHTIKRRYDDHGKSWFPEKTFDESKWMEEVFYSFQWLQYGGNRDRANVAIGNPPPPAEWTQAEFDDTAWLCQRQPYMMGTAGTLGWFRRAGYFRFPFDVTDPAAAALSLRLVYRGGCRVFVNGEEIARGHLPEGELDAEARGADYALEAYIEVGADGQPLVQKDRKGRGDSFMHVGELLGAFESAPPALDNKRKPIPDTCTIAKRHVSRATWTRVQETRDRVLEAAVPAQLLRKGGNVLAVEVRASDVHPVSIAGRHNWTTPFQGNVAWSHGQALQLQLHSSGNGALKRPKGPDGMQVWPEDPHRIVISREYRPEPKPGEPLRFVGAANGSFSGQIVVATERELNGLTFTPAPLVHADGRSRIPAEALEVRPMVPHPLEQWRTLGDGRGGMPYCEDPFIPPAELALARFGPLDAAQRSREERIELLKNIFFFDHIGTGAQPGLPAGSCRPSWVVLKVPSDAAPGTYRGSVRVAAQGLEPVDVAVEAEVHAWRVPEARHIQVHAALEQSPYGVAQQYGVPLWSDQHYERMEPSFRHLGLVGNDWLNIPVINYTEFGNIRDSMIGWTRRKDGSFAFDFAHLDRYLEFAVKHWGKPKVLNFIVMHGAGGYDADVMCADEATGKTLELKLGSQEPHYEAAWKAFGTALYNHLLAKGLHESMHWGYLWDSVADPELIGVLASVAPDAGWTAGAHRGKEHAFVKSFSQLLPFHLTDRSQQGWQKEDFHVVNPRGGGSLIAGPGTAYPFTFRLMPDRALVVGLNGVGRMGADYWGDIYIKGLKKEGFLRAGMPNHFMLWPGQEGADPSARFMALREGIQEAEARVFLEQQLSRKTLPEEMAQRAEKVLYEHHRQTLFIPSMGPGYLHVEMCRDWQTRSRALFACAAEAAQSVGLDLDRYALRADLPARGKKKVYLTLRGWTAKPRAWKVAASAPWIVPGKSEGQLTGQETLEIVLDAAALEPGATAKGTLTLSDAESGRSHEVMVEAAVSLVFEHASPTAALSKDEIHFIPDENKEVLDGAPGETVAIEVRFANRSGAPIAWKAQPGLPFVTTEPAEGTTQPGQLTVLKVSAALPANEVGVQASTLAILERDGNARLEIPLMVYALKRGPAPAMPTGEAVILDKNLHQKLLVSRKEWRPRWCGHEVIVFNTGEKVAKDGKERGVPVENVFTAPAPSEHVLKLEGQGFQAFSARVDLPRDCGGYKYWFAGAHAPPPDWTRIRFEVYVDGKLRGYSGWMGSTDDPQPLVVEGLAEAKELRLVTRFQKYPPGAVTGAWWNIRFHR